MTDWSRVARQMRRTRSANRKDGGGDPPPNPIPTDHLPEVTISPLHDEVTVVDVGGEEVFEKPQTLPFLPPREDD